MRSWLRFSVLLALVLIVSHANAAPAFDLAGPKIDVRVKRGDLTLPIAQVGNLVSKDRIWVHPDFPESQSERYVLVIAFLRGATNPPPNEWYTRVETWNSTVRQEGVYVNVPDEAQQAVLFLVPETGGDFNTLRKAVHDQPGSFVRAVQDLQAASLDRKRVEAFLALVKVTSQSDMKTLKERAELAARSLGIKLEASCFEKPSEQQASCLGQNPDSMVLDDSNVQSRVAQLTAGSTTDLMNNISSTTMGGSGAYSAYIGAIVDTAKILSSLHTAHFQYIPALALPTADTLNLRLNTPPSFRNPKSVVVVALPQMGPAKPQPLHPVLATEAYCAQKPGLVLPAEGAPLVFATELAHNLRLHVEAGSTPGGKADAAQSIDIPVVAETEKGGLVLKNPAPGLPAGELTGELRGKWGFDDWTGPHFHLRASGPGNWTLAATDLSGLVVGRDDVLHLEGAETLCIDRVEMHLGAGPEQKLTWKATHAGAIEIQVPLKNATPGPAVLSIYQYGMEKPETLNLKAYSDAASLESFALNVGDQQAQLRGTRLDEVAKAELDGIHFTPGDLGRSGDFDLLQLKADALTGRMPANKKIIVQVELKDGRALRIAATLSPARPQVALASHGVQDASGAAPAVQWGSTSDLPLDARLVFFLKSVQPRNFPRDQKVELAAVDGSFHTTLSVADGSVMLEDARTAMVTLEPLKRFGSSAFGPVQVRVVSGHGEAGDWLPLGTLVRLPGFRELRCPRQTSKPCSLIASNFFLAQGFAATQDFAGAVEVPAEFTGTQLSVPRPVGGVLYLKLRDDPDTVQVLTLPITLIGAADSKTDAHGSAGATIVAPPAGSAPSGPTAAPEGSLSAPDVAVEKAEVGATAASQPAGEAAGSSTGAAPGHEPPPADAPPAGQTPPPGAPALPEKK